MPWSFGFVVMLVCLFILLACGAVKMLFKRGMRLRADGSAARTAAGWSLCALR